MKKRNQRFVSVFLGVCIILLLNCCALLRFPAYLEEPKDPDQSLVVGYMDMEDAPTDLHFVYLYQLSPKTDKPWFGFGVNDGVFLMI